MVLTDKHCNVQKQCSVKLYLDTVRRKAKRLRDLTGRLRMSGAVENQGPFNDRRALGAYVDDIKTFTPQKVRDPLSNARQA